LGALILSSSVLLLWLVVSVYSGQNEAVNHPGAISFAIDTTIAIDATIAVYIAIGIDTTIANLLQLSNVWYLTDPRRDSNQRIDQPTDLSIRWQSQWPMRYE
jgi:hypothetical protein